MLRESNICTEVIKELQKELPEGYTVKKDVGEWKGAVSITRPNKTYFHAIFIRDVYKYLHYGE